MNAQVKTMTALVRRELWEHRAFWMVPTIMASLFTVLLIKLGVDLLTEVPDSKILRMNARMAEDGHLDSFAAQTHAATMAFTGIGVAVGVVMAFVALFYLLDCLYGDRRDRSILFWRSMPVTDAQTVLSKLLTVAVAAPLCAVGVLLAGFVAWGALGAAFGVAAGLDYWWIGLNPLAWLSAAAELLLATGGATLIMLPFAGWLMLASAYAPRAPFLWATLPVVAVAVLEEMVFDTSVFVRTVFGHFEALFPKMFGEGFEGFGIRGDGDDRFHIAGGIDFSAAFLLEPRLWIGLAIGVALIALTVRARRLRDDATT